MILDAKTALSLGKPDLAYHHALFSALMENSYDPVIVVNNKSEIIEWKRAAENLFGWSFNEVRNKAITDFIIPNRYHSKHSMGMKHYLETGVNKIINETVIVPARTKYNGEIKISIKINPLTTAIHKVLFIAVIKDLSKELKAEEDRKFYSQELNARLRTTTSLIQAIIRQSMPTADNKELSSLLSRLFAIDKAHTLLYSSDWKEANLYQLVRDVTYLYATIDRFEFVGSQDFKIPGNTAISFVIIIHELCTNALKFGSLSSSTGKVNIPWSRVGENFIWTWKEKGGPTVIKPKKSNFGIQFINRAFTGQGKAMIDYIETGLICTIVLKDSEMT